VTGKLSPKQEQFCLEYLIDLNATQAAIRAGYSEKTARQAAARLLSNVNIENRIVGLKNKRSARTEIGADYVLERHKEIDQLDILDIFKPDLSGFRPLDQWPKAWRTSITGLDVSELFDSEDGVKTLAGLIKKVKWPDKLRNLELLGKHVDVQAYNEKTTMDINAQAATINLVFNDGASDGDQPISAPTAE